jgi:hypothetical protein
MRSAAPTRQTVEHLRTAEEGSGRRILARDVQPQAARETGVTAESIGVKIRCRSAPVYMAAAEGWATREERRGKRKAREATGSRLVADSWVSSSLCVASNAPAASPVWRGCVRAGSKRPLRCATVGGQASGTTQTFGGITGDALTPQSGSANRKKKRNS